MSSSLDDERAAASWYRADLDALQAELQDVLRRRWPHVGSQLVSHALIELTGAVLAAIVEASPASVRDMDQRLEQMRLHVVTSGQQPQ